MTQSFFDEIVRDLARSGSRRDFVRRTTGLAAVFAMARAGVPPRWGRPVAMLFGVPAPCETDHDCGDPCLVCGVRAAGEAKSCLLKCQAVRCSECRHGQCIDTCPSCQFCYPSMDLPTASCETVEILRQCITCDEKTGKQTSLCTACEKCVQGECVSNCPNRCEICDAGTCRKCDRACEACDEATGQCYGCDPRCERCDTSSGQCETTCPGGFSCCYGECSDCCGQCGPKTHGECANLFESCPSGSDKYKGTTTVCCGEGVARRCADLRNDLDNCGSCENRCRHMAGSIGVGGVTEEFCWEGKCVCWKRGPEIGGLAAPGEFVECRKEGHECCFGECYEVAKYQTDPEHCGKCIIKCEKDEKCVGGECVGSKRAGYRLSYRMRRTSENYGVESEVAFQATVRALPKPDAEGNTVAGWGTYEGYTKNRKVNCRNDFPMDWETIPLVGRARGTASTTPDGEGQIFMTFVITPLDPPKMHIMTTTFRGIEGAAGVKEEDLPDALLPVVAPVTLRGGRGKDSKSFETPGDSCGGTVTHVSEWEVTKIE